MAPTLSYPDKLAISSQKLLVLSHQLSRMCQDLPMMGLHFEELSELTLYLPICLENVSKALILHNFDHENADYAGLCKDLDKLLDFGLTLYDIVGDLLPYKSDGEVLYDYPRHANSLMSEMRAIESAGNLISAVLELGFAGAESPGTEDTKVPSLQSRRRLLANNAVHSLKSIICSLAINTPAEPRSKDDPPSEVFKRHTDLTKWLEELLKGSVVKAATAQNENEKKPADKHESDHSDESDCHTVTPPSKFDGMPPHVPYDPNAVYVRVLQKYLDERTLKFFGLPWTVPKDDPQYFVIWKSLGLGECDRLFDHTKRLRAHDEHKKVKSETCVDGLLKRWMNIDSSGAGMGVDAEVAKELADFEEDLARLKISEENPRDRRRPDYVPRPRSPVRPFPEHRVKSVTDYWKAWDWTSHQLTESYKRAGWRPTYMRGSDSGQTWFYGNRVVHVRRFREDYSPREQPPTTSDLESNRTEYLMISKEWLEAEALIRHGFEYRSVGDCWAIDPRLSWADIDILLCTSGAFREERLLRKYRNLPGGDLHGFLQFAVPQEDYLQGPSLSSLSRQSGPHPPSFNEFHAVPMRSELPRFDGPMSTSHIPHRLNDLVEETEPAVHEAPAQSVHSPGLESIQSFVDVEREDRRSSHNSGNGHQMPTMF